MRHLQEIQLVPTILQTFSGHLSINTDSFLRQSQRWSSEGIDCSLRNTTLKPLKTKIQCYSFLIYSACNQIKTSSWSSSYYALVYLSMCVLVIFSGRALSVVLQKIITTNTLYDLILQWNLCGDLKANFSRFHSGHVQYNL